MKATKPKIIITKDGPYLVLGNLPLKKQSIAVDKQGNAIKWEDGQNYSQPKPCTLCRCGGSKNKPYCDGTHAKIKFDGTETASRKGYLKEAEKIKGPSLNLMDNSSLCADARFCDRAGGIWDLTRKSNDLRAKKTAIEEACNCPSGRLVIWDKKTKRPVEPRFKKCISLIEDPQEKVSGPLWVKGKVPVESSSGYQYEVRNRVTLCRCGKSNNKPFCDGSHIRAGFTSEDRPQDSESNSE